MIRPLNAFQNQQAVIAAIFQGEALDRVLDLRSRYATGRVINTRDATALFFLERRRPGIPLITRQPAEDIRVDYPFER